MAGNGEVGVDLDTAGAVGGAPVGLARAAAVSADGRTPAAQITVRLGMRSVFPSASMVTPRASIAVARAPSRTVTPSSASPSAALADSDSAKAGEHALAGVEQDHPRVGGSMRAKLAASSAAR